MCGVIVYKWTDVTGKLHGLEVEGITHHGERRDFIRPKTGKRSKRPSIYGSTFGPDVAFVVRMPGIGGRLHVAEGVLDALSLDPLGIADPVDGIIAAHGCDHLRKLSGWCSTYGTEALVYPHIGDNRATRRVSFCATRRT